MLNFYSDDSDIDDIEILIECVNTIPRIRFYPERPDLFLYYDDTKFRQRFRFSKESVVRLAEIFDPYLKRTTKRSKALSTMHLILLALRYAN